jgi:glycine/D-amino acid oxidase-like deaminating enzyme
MKVIILGSGVIGVSTAYYLAKAGHQVTVVDRQNGAGLETSFANAGQVSPGYSAPWAAPGIPLKALKWLAGELTADAYVLALGSYSPLLSKRLGIRIPVYPVKGYSITVPITNPNGAPESTVMDETFKVAVTRLGDRIRVGGTAELAGYNLKLRQARRDTLDHVVTDLFPRGGDISKAEFWTGLRPMTPDGTPIIGPTSHSNLFLNTGHGTLDHGCGLRAGVGGCHLRPARGNRSGRADPGALPRRRPRRTCGDQRSACLNIIQTDQAPPAIGRLLARHRGRQAAAALRLVCAITG